LPSSSLSGVSSLILFPLFATGGKYSAGVIDTGGNLPPASLTPAANLPLVSLHRWQLCHRCQQHKGNWWQILLPVSLIPEANLLPVSLIPAAICHHCH
jgi:hypothetical protein